MRAVVYRPAAPGAPLVIDRPAPPLRAGHVRIRVEAAAINPADVWTAAGQLDVLLGPVEGDHVLGWDVAGTVVETGDGVTDLAPGTRVIAMAQQFPAGPGTHAEQVVLPAADVVAAPSTVDAAPAATLPLNAMTASQALDLLALPPGATLLVTGAAGAVGGYAVELAVEAGLTVIAATRAEDASWLRERGASQVLTERGADLVAAARRVAPGGVDGTLDAAPVGPPLIAAVRDGGAFVSVLVPATPDPERGVRVELQQVTADGERLARLVALVDHGLLTLRVAETWPLDEAAAAYAAAAKGGLRGRVVLLP